ncbi:molybdenum cofactor guanylyltransferase [Halalkalibacter alkalisediminis]|uniref:Probable molybdenum cofactor guanylyltransferase n=1 Tax=Halalkalibacter alkalisediminis TaxID=935616 RepID=A0ABV6NPD8_9BACI|nr:molybdenum cofactor guanylyltransferase [Halalkalibacter alkalisediminis]
MRMVGVILAGGQSSRYGKPKMFEIYKGLPFYQHSVNALNTNSAISSVYIVTNELLSSRFDDSSASILIEKQQHNGPLHALTFALDTIEEADWFFVLASDIPFVTAELARSLIQYTTDSSIDAIVPIAGEKEQPLLALYHKRCLPYAKDIIAQNKKSMRPLLQAVRVKWIHFPDNQKDFTNINRQEEWKIEKD